VLNREEKKMKQDKSDIKFSEKISLAIRKTIIVSKLFTILIVIALIAAFIGLNLLIKKVDLPEIDVTSSKLYTLSESSKAAIVDLDQDVKIYVYGIEEESPVVGLIKQYCRENDKITYEMLSNESNLEKVQEFELQEGYSIIVVESADSHKIIDASSDFSSYDYTTYQQVDITEQTLTDSILSLSTQNKPKVYFVQGHEEFSISSGENSNAELGVLTTYLKNEAFEIEALNIMTTGNIPEDCDVLAIMSPSKDFLENEANAVIEYIGKGGNIFMTKDVITQGTEFPNLQRILDEYGVSIKNGYVIEKDSNSIVSNAPYVFMPKMSNYNEVTADIYSDSYIWLAYAQKIDFKSDEELNALNVMYEPLLWTSDSATFITDFSADLVSVMSTAETGEFTVAALVTKIIEFGTMVTGPDKSAETPNIESKLIICANGEFITDYIVPELSNQYPLSYLGGNKDFAINAIASLADKKESLTIRKNLNGISYAFTATQAQNRIVLAIIFVVPVIILILGIVIWKYRRKRK